VAGRKMPQYVHQKRKNDEDEEGSTKGGRGATGWVWVLAVAGGSLLQVMVTSQMRKRSLRGKTPSRSALRRSTRQPGHLGRYAFAFFASSGSPSWVVSPLPPPILARSDSERSNPGTRNSGGDDVGTRQRRAVEWKAEAGRELSRSGGRQSAALGLWLRPAGLPRSSVRVQTCRDAPPVIWWCRCVPAVLYVGCWTKTQKEKQMACASAWNCSCGARPRGSHQWLRSALRGNTGNREKPLSSRRTVSPSRRRRAGIGPPDTDPNHGARQPANVASCCRRPVVGGRLGVSFRVLIVRFGSATRAAAWSTLCRAGVRVSRGRGPGAAGLH
jgi:hypothetical protein